MLRRQRTRSPEYDHDLSHALNYEGVEKGLADWSRYQYVHIGGNSRHIKIMYASTVGEHTFLFGRWRLVAQTKKQCCETFQVAFNKISITPETTAVLLRAPATTFSLQYAHRLKVILWKTYVKDTLTVVFDGTDDRITFSNLMPRSYVHAVELYANDELQFITYL